MISSQLIADMRPPLQLVAIQRLAIAATGHDQHLGCDQLDPPRLAKLGSTLEEVGSRKPVNNSSAPLANFREGAHQIWRQSSKINASSSALMMIQRTANLMV
jgi:hypothetical protein